MTFQIGKPATKFSQRLPPEHSRIGQLVVQLRGLQCTRVESVSNERVIMPTVAKFSLRPDSRRHRRPEEGRRQRAFGAQRPARRLLPLPGSRDFAQAISEIER